LRSDWQRSRPLWRRMLPKAMVQSVFSTQGPRMPRYGNPNSTEAY
jgi:hypothetical protein